VQLACFRNPLLTSPTPACITNPAIAKPAAQQLPPRSIAAVAAHSILSSKVGPQCTYGGSGGEITGVTKDQAVIDAATSNWCIGTV